MPAKNKMSKKKGRMPQISNPPHGNPVFMRRVANAPTLVLHDKIYVQTRQGCYRLAVALNETTVVMGDEYGLEINA